MKFEILGPMRVYGPDGQADLGAPQLRALLAVLLTRPNETVSRPQLAQALWPANQPKRLKDALHVCAHRLRKLLDDPARITCRTGGYVVTVERDELDWHRFQDLVRQARAVRAAGHREAACQLFRQAVSHWRGKPFAEFDHVDVLQAEASAMTEQYLAALEELAEVDLALGHTHDVLAGMRMLTGEHPFRERAHELLMLALVRSGSPGESLNHYQRLREHLAADLGTDPSDRLRRLYQRILSEDPELAEGDQVRRAVVPRQLPSPSPLFTGRNRELTSISRAVEERVIVTITGPGGAGKSALALHWAHANADRFPDGQLYLNLRGYSPAGTPMTTGEALRTLLVSMGLDETALPADTDARAARYRSILADTRTLVLLDNAHDTEQVTALLPGTASCAVVVTSRHQLTALVASQAAHALSLRALDVQSARSVVAGHVGADRIAAEPHAVDEIIQHCGGLALALVIAGARAAVNPSVPLSVLADELRDGSTRLDALRTGELNADLGMALASTCRALDDDAIHVFEMLGIVPGVEIGLPAVSNLIDRPSSEARAILRRLQTVHLVHQNEAGRFAMHDLVRRYACERALLSPEDGARDAALARLRSFYLHTGYAAERLLDPHRPGIELAQPPPNRGTVSFADAADAIGWFNVEHQNLLCLLKQAAESHLDREVWYSAWVLHTFHWRRGHLVDGLMAWKAALTAADRLGDRGMRARAHRRLAAASMRCGEPVDAWTHVRAALVLFEEARDLAGQARTHEVCAWIAEQRGDHHLALHHATRALQLHRLHRDPAREANALNSLGYYQCKLGMFDEAMAACESALASHRELGYRDGEAYALETLGFVARAAGRVERALEWYSQAVTVLRELGDTYQVADTLASLGEIHAAVGRRDAAHRAWAEALSLYEVQRRDDQSRQMRRLTTSM